MNSLRTIILALILLSAAGTASLSADEKEYDKSTASGLLDSSYNTMIKADLYRDAGQADKAMEAYRTALSGFVKVSHKYPELDPEVVKFRMVYCDNQIETLMKERGVNGDKEPSTPKGRESKAPSAVQTAPAKAVKAEMKLQNVREKIQKRDLDGARDDLITMMKSNPDDPETRILLAIVQCMLGRFDDADNMMSTLIEEKPGLTDAYEVLSTAKIGLGQIKESRAALEKAIELGSTTPETYYNLTQIILATKPMDVDAARESYKKSLDLGGSKDPDLDYLLK